jgi:hypothetical protein
MEGRKLGPVGNSGADSNKKKIWKRHQVSILYPPKKNCTQALKIPRDYKTIKLVSDSRYRPISIFPPQMKES